MTTYWYPPFALPVSQISTQVHLPSHSKTPLKITKYLVHSLTLSQPVHYKADAGLHITIFPNLVKKQQSVGRNIKLLRGKILRTFQILKSCKLFPHVSIKNVRDKEISEYNITPLEPIITHINVDRLNIEISSLIIIEQWKSLIFAIDIHSKCN